MEGESPDSLSFVLDVNGVFLSAKSNGNLTFYTDVANFINRSVMDVLPFNAASIILAAVRRCTQTKEIQEFDYQLGDGFFHAKMGWLWARGIPTSTRLSDGVWAIVTRQDCSCLETKLAGLVLAE